MRVTRLVLRSVKSLIESALNSRRHQYSMDQKISSIEGPATKLSTSQEGSLYLLQEALSQHLYLEKYLVEETSAASILLTITLLHQLKWVWTPCSVALTLLSLPSKHFGDAKLHVVLIARVLAVLYANFDFKARVRDAGRIWLWNCRERVKEDRTCQQSDVKEALLEV